MSNPLFSALGGQPQQPNIYQSLQQIKANPAQFLMMRGLNIPQGMSSDPNAILRHLLSSGQVNQGQVNAAYQMAQRFGLM